MDPKVIILFSFLFILSMFFQEHRSDENGVFKTMTVAVQSQFAGIPQLGYF